MSKDCPSRSINESKKYIINEVGNKRMEKCFIGLILGSGLGSFADSLQDKIIMDYKNIPNWPQSTIVGHAGKLIVGHIPQHEDTYVMAMQGRKHYYECTNMDLVTFPVRVFKELKLDAIFVTNATGGINESFSVGDLMVIVDHINMMPNPCIGPNFSRHGPRFHDMTQAYDAEFRSLVKKAALQEHIDLQEGVYLAVTGPSYETPAEICTFRRWGADCVGASTAPEVIVGRHCGLRCVGVSCITNMAAGIVDGVTLDHHEVEQNAGRQKHIFSRLLSASLVKIHRALWTQREIPREQVLDS